MGGAFVQQFRFAAADNAPPEFKARAISFVLAGGVITAILGPQIVIFTHDLFAPVMFAGSFAAIPIVAAVGALILSFLRPASISAARVVGHVRCPATAGNRHASRALWSVCCAASAPSR